MVKLFLAVALLAVGARSCQYNTGSVSDKVTEAQWRAENPKATLIEQAGGRTVYQLHNPDGTWTHMYFQEGHGYRYEKSSSAWRISGDAPAKAAPASPAPGKTAPRPAR